MGLKIESVVEEKITSTISKLGFEIEYVEYVKEANNYILRIVLDKPSGTVDVDECEKVSRAVEDIIDTIIKNEYVLEVSSPGIERQLRNIRLYKKYVGKNVILPIVNKKIPVIEDEHADPEFGTGVVKITPAHDPNDFEVGNRHNLERIKVINPNGTMNKNAGKYQGLDRFECRKELINDLKNQNLLIKIELIYLII